MKKKFIIILLMVLLLPIKVFAAGGFSVTPTSVSMNPGDTKTITITPNNAVGKLSISSSNTSAAGVSIGSIQNTATSFHPPAPCRGLMECRCVANSRTFRQILLDIVHQIHYSYYGTGR